MAKRRASARPQRISPMPRFHFDVHDSAERRGRGSLDLPDLEAARDKARSLAVVYASDPDNVTASDGIVVTVWDATLSTLTIVRMACKESPGGPA
ncbi:MULTISPECIES: DUF6894 family protein [Methylobacterium]|uniref:DUF6894 domain-containing protein n=1 Tax=Methylobacterium thuringiense TaxID=1003091 RepID=A0ABQ4TMC9_9HYPH|nr:MULTISPECIES: hypothetical protein [Methylobacterium]TXN23698.1 hypothetical protein FV217_05770 [Methylobacterium sp. WL9]GJE56156.1 hypothetical protein EKPJFOCH_2655 [Methylobacterium thuringiense]